MVRRARERGALAPGARIIESSSGTLGLGLALAGLVYAHPVTVVTDRVWNRWSRSCSRPTARGWSWVTDPHPVGGWQQARRDRVRELLAAEPGAWCPDQYSNPDNVDAYESLARELIEQLGGVDVLVCAVGTRRPLRGHRARPAPHQSRAVTDRRGHGGLHHLRPAGRSPPHARAWAPASTPTMSTTRRSVKSIGWHRPKRSGPAAPWPRATCPAAAGASARSRWWPGGPPATRPAGTRIAAVFPDGPHRYFDTVYNDSYCAAHGLLGRHNLRAPTTSPTRASGRSSAGPAAPPSSTPGYRSPTPPRGRCP
ncbi:pyridoxal-phosphate dependent enzyme [Nocardia tengchongensis]|uniref:Pyridoxal-phosphate dependent enzyme n=1 Tax=Nocardia tengchongensis TaxID=2055889 RepID=A0ABX8CJL2_9NOCA|nr:pyridoxal-phosphate dependent enzyme [Nocardia tengchongensis]